MDERRQNIEEWLKQAASRQQGGRTPEAEKQQAWQKLHSMLDADVPSSGGRSWTWIMDVILLFVVGILVVQYSDAPKRGNIHVQEKKVDADRGINVESGDGKDESRRNDDRKSAGNKDGKDENGRNDDRKSAENKDGKDENGRNDDKKSAENKDGKDESGRNDDKKSAGNKDGKDESGGNDDKKNAENKDGKDESRRNDGKKSAENKDGKDESRRNDDEKSAGNKDEKDESGKNDDKKSAENKGGKDESGKSNDVKGVKNGRGDSEDGKNSKSGDCIGNSNDEESVKNGNENTRHAKIDQAALSVLFTKQLIPAKIAMGLSHVNQRHIPDQSSPAKIKDLLSNAFSMNISLTLPADGQYGASLAAEYNYRLWDRLFIRPRAGFSYMNTGIRKYSHSAYFPREDTTPSPGTPYWVDSLVTDYSVKSILYGVAGLQIAYRYKKLEIFTGIAYRHQLAVTGSDSSYTKSRATIGTPPVYQRERFNKKRLPGTKNLQWQAGLNYMLNRHLQAGASYNILLQKSAAQTGLGEQAPVIPVSSSLELHLRWFFRKK